MNVHRELDIPGSEVPGVWFDFLREGKTDRLEQVFAHNLEDIVSLARLLNLMENLAEAGSAEKFPFSLFHLGLIMYLRYPARGVPLLERACNEKDPEARRFLATVYKRKNRWEKALGIWEEINSEGLSFYAVEELAKYYEHRAKDPEKALKLVNKLLNRRLPLPGDRKASLLHRKQRLEKKLSSE
jgi:hypothetical protein